MKGRAVNACNQVRRQLASFLKGIPIASYQRIAHILQTASATLLVAGLIGLAVAGDSVTPGEAGLILVMALIVFVCGTILDVKTEQKIAKRKTENAQ